MKKGLLFTLIATIVMASMSFAEDVSVADLLARIEALEKRVAALESGEYRSETDTTEKATEQTEPLQVDHEPTVSEKNALAKAKRYLSVMSFSKSGIVKQLEHDGFPHEDALYAAENCEADWHEQAAIKAKRYLDIMPFSYTDLIKQLEHDGFSTEEATYGADVVYQ